MKTEFEPLALEDLRREAAVLKADGWRFIQTHAVKGEAGIDLYYSFMKDGGVLNYRIGGVTPDQPVPSITDLFLAAFVFENEARELFGVDMRDIAIDFQGAMYAPAQAEPMTFISPEQKAAREKARKAAAAKREKAAQAENAGEAPAATQAGGRVFTMTPELQARLDAKYPTLSDEKKAKVDAALAARKAEAEAAASGSNAAVAAAPTAVPEEGKGTAPASMATEKLDTAPADATLEEKIAAMDPEKAAKVRAALEGKAAGSADAGGAGEPPAGRLADAQLDDLINLMDDAKAATVRAALATKGGE